ncbi:hypothetical protein [Actinospongicola halichondriae]|uniref:hypothetical protein n=1 Tax=Actinospongicola halichondriae TaxID=3236844 RepID=UPI003D5CB28A
MDKSVLFQSRLPEKVVTIPGLGDFTVRGLSRAEVMQIQKIGASDASLIERKMLSMALIDPVLTEGEARQWQEASPATEIEPVTDAIAELSGMKEGSDRQVYDAMDDDPDLEFSFRPGREARQDSQ